MLKLLRCIFRCGGLAVIVLGYLLDWTLSILVRGRARDYRARSRLLRRWARRTIRLMDCRVSVQGVPPLHGLCVSNHLSYLDIVVFASVAPCVFVSKQEVRYWPLFGQLATGAGTLFISRERKGHVADVGDQMATVLNERVPLILFPEGTSSGGDGVLPFKSSLFQPAIAHAWPVTPMWIGYELEDGTVASEVAYWGDMTLLPHLLNLFTKRFVRARVRYGHPVDPGSDRKALCRRAYDAVVRLSAAEPSRDVRL